MTDVGLLHLAASARQLTRLDLSESRHLTPAGLAAALPLLPALAELDLTACSGAGDDQLLEMLANQHGGGASGCGPVTPANIALPQGGRSPTGSPFRLRAAAG